MIDLTLYPLALLAIILIVQICKKWISPKWGNFGVQVFIAFLSLIAAGFWFAKDLISVETLGILVSIWVSANGIYQILGKYIFDALGELVNKK